MLLGRPQILQKQNWESPEGLRARGDNFSLKRKNKCLLSRTGSFIDKNKRKTGSEKKKDSAKTKKEEQTQRTTKKNHTKRDRTRHN